MCVHSHPRDPSDLDTAAWGRREVNPTVESDIQDFWQTHPCGDALVGGLHDESQGDYEAFFTRYDDFRYTKEKHILGCLDAIDFKGKRVLEIGLGQGADAEQIIRRGALWSGLDLTQEAVDRTETRLRLRNLPFEAIKQGSALTIPFENNSFDIVFSHGVLHHIPEIRSAQREIARVLKPDGELIAMLYAKWSLNYLLAIGVVRRVGLVGLKLTGKDPGGIYSQHLKQARELGLVRYLKMRNFIHLNTDGPRNPYAKIYDEAAIAKDFPSFELVRTYKRFMHAPPLKVGWLPLERVLGWHLWAHLKPVKSTR